MKQIIFYPEAIAQQFDPGRLVLFSIVNCTGKDEDDPAAPLGRIIPGIEIEIPLADPVFESIASSLRETMKTHDVVITIESSCDLSEIESGYAPVKERTIEFVPKNTTEDAPEAKIGLHNDTTHH
jgi:hypothetical protein